jgi:hypothetical protein
MRTRRGREMRRVRPARKVKVKARVKVKVFQARTSSLLEGRRVR